MFVICALILLTSLYLYLIHLNHLRDDAKVGVPGPKGIPFLGSILEVFPYIKAQNVFVKLHEYHNIYGNTYQIRLGPVKMIVSRDPKITEIIANNPKLAKSAEYDLVRPWLGDSLLLSEGEKWHKMRKLITPAFHFQILERFLPVFEEQAKIMIEIVKTDKNIIKGIDVFPKFHALTLDIVSETSMGVKLNAQSDSHNPFIEANKKIVDIFDKRAYNGFLQVEWIFRLTPLYKVQKDAISCINRFVDNVIKQRRDKLLKESQESDAEESDSKKRPALLDILLQAMIDGKPLSNEDIQAEVKTFMFAGHDTTADTLSFTIFFIARHPDVQQKLFDEIQSRFLNNKSDSNLTIRQLNSLSYMDNVIKEALRLYPAAPMVFKRFPNDIQIGRIFIPKKTSIATNLYSGHRIETYFVDAEKFNPDRFGKELTSKEQNLYIYQPFSSGLRNCIGQKYAMLEIKTVLVKIISAFEIELIDKNFALDVIQLGTLKSRHGVHVKFNERKN